MRTLNNTTDREKYLKNGPMTQPFLVDEMLTDQIGKAKTDREKVTILLKYIHRHNKHSFDKQYNKDHKFQRTAEEVWESGRPTGCSDWAMVFATLARQYGIPTSFLATAEKGWSEQIRNGEEVQKARGHAFCECYMDDKWQLVDPTAPMIQKDYDIECIHLTNLLHNVDFRKNFIPYRRGFDIGYRQDQQKYIEAMANGVLGEPVEDDDEQELSPKIDRISKEELKNVGYEPQKPDIEVVEDRQKHQESKVVNDEQDEERQLKKHEN